MPVQPSTQFVNVVEGVVNKQEKEESICGTIRTWSLLNWQAILAEFVSTLLLLFLGCMTCVPNDAFPVAPPLYSPLGFGLVVLFNIQSFGHISGAHMNPAVTLGAVLWGKMSVMLGFFYVIAQCSGAAIGYGILISVSPVDLRTDGVCMTLPHANHDLYQALVIEIILTAALNFLNCAVWDPVNENRQESNSLKFGFTIAALSIAGGPLTGASMNPARSLGPTLWSGIWRAHWVYWLGPLLGGSFAALFYKYTWLKEQK